MLFNPDQEAPCDACDAFDFDSDSPFFTPEGSGTSSPTTAISLALDPLEFPHAQSGPASPFVFPGNLVGFSELAVPLNEESSFDVPVAQFHNNSAQTAPIQLPLLFQPHSLLDHAATGPGSQIASEQTSSAFHCTCPMSCNAVGGDSVPTSGAASVISQVLLLGDEAMSAYGSRKLSAYEVESAVNLPIPLLLIHFYI